MQAPRRVDIHKQSRLLDDFFKIDEIVVSHEQYNGAMSPDQRRLVFERGDSVAVLLLDLEKNSVILTEQFKVPTLTARRRDDPSSTNGWITEAVAGMVDPGETPEAAVIRETMEETGYRIANPRLIAKFFSSPGGTSERIFLYFSKVHETDRTGKGGGIDDEDIKILQMPVEHLLDRLHNGSIEDPKLIVAAYWLQDHLRSLQDRAHLVAGVRPPPAPAPQPLSEPLGYTTARYAIQGRNDLIVGYKTGAIDDITGVSIWVNSENTDMMMDRFIGKSISAKIRFLGANKDEHDNVVEDTIEEALRSAVGQHVHVRIGTVLMTESGMLKSTHRVERILHVATVEGGAGTGVKADLSQLKQCVQNVLMKADEENKRLWRILFNRKNFESILIPMLGAGAGHLSVEDVARTIIPTAVNYFENTQIPTLKEIYFLAFTSGDKNACDEIFDRFCSDGLLIRI